MISFLEDSMGIKVRVIFYSMYGHVYRMAEAVLAGVKEVVGAEASLFQAAEIVPDAILEKSGAKAARAAFAHVPVATVDSLAEPHAKIGSVFASAASQHGGQETTPTRFHSTLLHHGMIIVGVP
jgi:NAD(P)H dehydrogenase (quinone)